MKHTALTAALLAFCLGSFASAQTIEEGHIGCTSEGALDEFMTAARNNDLRQGDLLLGSVCFPIGGLEFSEVDMGLLKSIIRVYTENGTAVLWVVSEAAR